MDNLQKIFWVLLVFTAILWVGVGIFYWKTSRSEKVPVVPAFSPPTPILKDFWQTYETPQFSIKYPQGWSVVPGQEDNHPFYLTPPLEENQLYQGISLYLGRNTLNLSARRWAELDFAEKEEISFEEVPIQQKVGIKVRDEKENKLRIYLSDGAETMYIFFLKGRSLSPQIEDKFVEIVSTFQIKN